MGAVVTRTKGEENGLAVQREEEDGFCVSEVIFILLNFLCFTKACTRGTILTI